MVGGGLIGAVLFVFTSANVTLHGLNTVSCRDTLSMSYVEGYYRDGTCQRLLNRTMSWTAM